VDLPAAPPKKRKPRRKLHTTLTPALCKKLCAVFDECADLIIAAGRTQTSVYHLREWVGGGSRGESPLEIVLYNAFMATLAEARARMLKKAMIGKSKVPWEALEYMTPKFGDEPAAADTQQWLASLDDNGRAELREALARFDTLDAPPQQVPSRLLPAEAEHEDD
jgi:hypothetical protein